jgi:hypothetical protein
MRRVHIISIITILLFFEGCDWERKWLDGIRPEANAESYTAVLRYDSTGQYDSIGKYYHGVVANRAARIDSSGVLQALQQLDSVSYLSNVDPHVITCDETSDLIAKDGRKVFTDISPKYFFSAMIDLQDTDYLLLRGMTTSEYHEVVNWRIRQDRKLAGRGCNLWGPIEGYWMVANTKTGKIKEIGYEDYYPIVSSSGRHILFYRRDGDDYRMKVVSVKDLLERM